MKRYSFRLAQVLRVRTIELDRAKAAVAVARAELGAAQELTIARQRDYEEVEARPPISSMAELRARREHQRLAADAVCRARAAEALKEQVVANRLADWVEADRKVRLLEQLDERHRARHTAELAAEEQKVLDDLVTSRQEASA